MFIFYFSTQLITEIKMYRWIDRKKEEMCKSCTKNFKKEAGKCTPLRYTIQLYKLSSHSSHNWHTGQWYIIVRHSISQKVYSLDFIIVHLHS